MNEPLIVSDPRVMMGKPVVAGTRITVELILEKLAAGETVEQVLDAHPRLTRQSIQAALDFAARGCARGRPLSGRRPIGMILLADESVDRFVVERLRQEGHDVVAVTELSPSIADEEVLQQANDRGALLVTADKDFGELVFRQGRIHTGVVLLRLAGLPTAAKVETVAAVFRLHGTELAGAFCVISPGAVRIRRGPKPDAPPA